MKYIEPVGGDISDMECPICELSLIYIEYAYKEDETELGLVCENSLCKNEYQIITPNADT